MAEQVRRQIAVGVRDNTCAAHTEGICEVSSVGSENNAVVNDAG